MSEFYLRREKLFANLTDNSMALLSSGSEQIRNRDVEYPFRVESSFYYLTGFSEPDAVLLLVKKQGECRAVIFLRPKDPEQETWQGRRLGIDSAIDALKVDEAFDIDELAEKSTELVENLDSIYFSFAELTDWADLLAEWVASQKSKSRQGIVATSQFKDIDVLLHEARLIKSSWEITKIRQAAQISVKGHLATLKIARGAPPCMWEYQVQAALEAEFKQNGSPRVAFNSIVASGKNACILHYTENDQLIEQDSLVLVDAGAEYAGYAGDITSVFPANGKFSPAQKQLYDLTLKAQQAVIGLIKPGVEYNKLHECAASIITQGLVDLGILTGKLETLLNDEEYKKFFMHGTGHWLGMDVHDVGSYKQNGCWRPLQAGMVLTVEPGIYISKEVGLEQGVDAKYWDIGIRIEDDILVTKEGAEVLTLGLPRTTAEIEKMMEGK